MKTIIITTIVSIFATVMVSSYSTPANVQSPNSDREHIALVDFRKDIGSAD